MVFSFKFQFIDSFSTVSKIVRKITKSPLLDTIFLSTVFRQSHQRRRLQNNQRSTTERNDEGLKENSDKGSRDNFSAYLSESDDEICVDDDDDDTEVTQTCAHEALPVAPLKTEEEASTCVLDVSYHSSENHSSTARENQTDHKNDEITPLNSHTVEDDRKKDARNEEKSPHPVSKEFLILKTEDKQIFSPAKLSAEGETVSLFAPGAENKDANCGWLMSIMKVIIKKLNKFFWRSFNLMIKNE